MYLCNTNWYHRSLWGMWGYFYYLGKNVSNPLTNPLNHLFSNATFSEITPITGTEIKGIQLSSLDEKAKDELSVLVARRRVVVFRDQVCNCHDKNILIFIYLFYYFTGLCRPIN